MSTSNERELAEATADVCGGGVGVTNDLDSMANGELALGDIAVKPPNEGDDALVGLSKMRGFER